MTEEQPHQKTLREIDERTRKIQGKRGTAKNENPHLNLQLVFQICVVLLLVWIGLNTSR